MLCGRWSGGRSSQTEASLRVWEVLRGPGQLMLKSKAWGLGRWLGGPGSRMLDGSTWDPLLGKVGISPRDLNGLCLHPGTKDACGLETAAR